MNNALKMALSRGAAMKMVAEVCQSILALHAYLMLLLLSLSFFAL
jgi:hypothetical protein